MKPFNNAFVAIAALEKNPYFDMRIREIAVQVDYNVGDRPSAGRLQELLQEYDLLVIGIREKISSPDSETIRTKMIATLSIATAHIDTGLIDKFKVVVVNSPTANVPSVAEHSITLMLAAAKRLWQARDGMVSGNGRNSLSRLPTELKGKTLGILGFGKIGKKVAELGSCLGMTVCSNTLHPEKYTQYSTVSFVSLEKLFELSNFLSIHVPVGNSTLNIVSGELLSRANDGLILINTSGKEVLENSALSGLLDSQKLTAVGLDYDSDEWGLSERDDVYMTPHIAGLTIESDSRIDNELVDNIIQAVISVEP
jgi:D-3-phosphoglycerate dehydrogenase